MAPCWGFSTLPAATWGSGYVREGLGAPWSGLCVCTHECAYARLCVCLAGAGCRLFRRRLTRGGEAVGQPRTAPILVVCPWQVTWLKSFHPATPRGWYYCYSPFSRRNPRTEAACQASPRGFRPCSQFCMFTIANEGRSERASHVLQLCLAAVLLRSGVSGAPELHVCICACVCMNTSVCVSSVSARVYLCMCVCMYVYVCICGVCAQLCMDTISITEQAALCSPSHVPGQPPLLVACPQGHTAHHVPETQFFLTCEMDMTVLPRLPRQVWEQVQKVSVDCVCPRVGGLLGILLDSRVNSDCLCSECGLCG